MDLTEKIAYIKGLADGLSLDENKPEVKLINAIIDLLDDIAYDVQDVQELYDELSEEVDEIDQDLADVEEEVFGDDDDDDFDDFDDYDDYDFDDDDAFYEVTCDKCGEQIEFDFSNIFSEEDDDCDLDCDSCEFKESCGDEGDEEE